MRGPLTWVLVATGIGGAVFALSDAACLGTTNYQCASAGQCANGNTIGRCESDGFCSFPDGTCASGYRYGDLSGSVANQCVGIPPDARMADAPPDSPPDTPPADARWCFGAGAYELCFAAAPTGTVALSGSLNTDTDSHCGPLPSDWTTNSQPDACLVAANQINVIATLTVTGSRPLVLVGQTVDVGALIDVSSHLGGTVGPASPSSLCATFPTTPTDSTSGAGGAAGASFMTIGGGGGKGGGTASGVAAPAADVTTPAILRAGCKGELGGTGATAAGAFGAGGGAIYIAANSLTLSGVIDASGAGAHGGGFSSGGSGAGSGGMIVLWATALNATGGKLLANGGGGASGGIATVAGVNGNDPSAATPTTAATGGAAGNAAGDGGNGFAGASAATAGGTGSTNGNKDGGGGGGGGGAGYIQSNLVLGGASVSPAATIVP